MIGFILALGNGSLSPQKEPIMANHKKRVTIFECTFCHRHCSLTEGYEFSGLDSGAFLKKETELRAQNVCPTVILSTQACPLCTEAKKELYRTPVAAYQVVSGKRDTDDSFGDKGPEDY